MVGRLWSLADVFGHLVMLWGYVWSLGQLWWGRLMTERVSQSLVGWCRACPLPTTHSLRNRALVTHILSYHRITTLPFWPTPKTSRISFPLLVLRRQARGSSKKERKVFQNQMILFLPNWYFLKAMSQWDQAAMLWAWTQCTKYVERKQNQWI